MDPQTPVPSNPTGPQLLEEIVVKRWQFGAIVSWGITALVAAGGTLALALIRHKLSLYVPLTIFCVCLFFGILSVIMARKQFENWSFEIEDESLILRHGIFWKRERYLARGRLQHLDINSGPIDRRFGVVEVGVFVAGSAAAVGSIPGLSNERAEALRDYLLQKRDRHA